LQRAAAGGCLPHDGGFARLLQTVLQPPCRNSGAAAAPEDGDVAAEVHVAVDVTVVVTETRGLAQIPGLVEVTGEDHVIGALVALPEELGEVLCGAPLRLGVPVPRLLGG